MKSEYVEKLQVHSRGKGIKEVINKYRPSEPEFIKNYRSENCRAVTTAYWRKATQIVRKAKRAAGIDIKYLEGSEPTKEWAIATKLQQKLFGEYLDLILEDPRCAFVVVDSLFHNDLTGSDAKSEVKVFAIPSEDIIEATEYQLFCNYKHWFVLFDFEKGEITTYKKDKGEYVQLYTYVGLQGNYFYGGGSRDALSFFDGVVDFWLEALVQYSDLQGSIKSHAFPLPVTMQVEDCSDCGGSGKIKTASGINSCGTCHGKGYISASPYAEIKASVKNYKENPQLPWPPVIYPQRDLEPIRLLKEEYESNILRGLQAINMEFISLIGATQSGIAKAMDRDELNGSLYDWCDHLFNYLYFNIVKNAGIYIQGVEVLTHTVLPENFDVYGIESAEANLKNARESNVPNNLLRSIEQDYVRRKYEGRPLDQAFNDDLITFDFTYGLKPDEVEIQLLNGGISKIDYQMSTNLFFLLKKGYQNPAFAVLGFMEKYDWLISETEKKGIKSPSPEM